MPPAKQLSTESVTKRIHVGGLAPSVTAKELVQRFSSFGSVIGGEQAVDGLGKHDNGLPRSFAFFNLETTDAKFARCMSMLNGSMWKAHKLRIAPAKVDWQERRSTERAEVAALESAPVRPKKRKRSKDPNVGIVTSRFELVTEENIKRHRGWVLDTKPSPAPLFPLLVRPPHPIELPAKPAATAWTRGKAKAKPSKAAREALRLGIPLEKPALQRAKRMRIDPRRWGRQKIVFDASKKNEAANMLTVGSWECEAVKQEEGEAEPVATWVFKGRDGSVKMRETVRLSQQRAYTDRFTALLERMNRPSAAVPAAATPAESAPPPIAISPVEPTAVDSDSDSASPLRKPRARSTSPPPYIPAVPRNLMYNEEDAFQLMAAALGDEERDAAHALERSELVKLAAGAIEEAGADLASDLPVASTSKAADGRPLPKVEGFADDDDDDSDLFPAMRLRGGGGASSDSSSDEDSSDDESSSSDDDESSSELESSSEGSSRTEKQESEEDAKMEDAAPAKEKEASKTSLVKDSLKNMFKPQEEIGGFSLLSGLDLDLDVERTPSPEPITIPIAAAFPPQRSFAPAPTFRGPRAQAVPSGPSLPFFAFPSGEFEERSTGEVNEEEVEKLGMSVVAIERARAESKQRFEDAAMGFWRSETMEQIEEDHQKLRETLRGVARKRHREAAKRSKKKAGRRAGGVALDTVDDE
ncbi:hypothetical protein JCM6882_003840 [Rhodosporidiobolus microsporus]